MHKHDTHLPPSEQPLPLQHTTTRKRGRPPKPDALSDAERARRYRARKKARQAELCASEPVGCAIAPAPKWKRCWAKAMALMGQARATLLGFCGAAWRLRG